MLGGFSVGSAEHIERSLLITNLSKKKKDIHLYCVFLCSFVVVVVSFSYFVWVYFLCYIVFLVCMLSCAGTDQVMLQA